MALFDLLQVPKSPQDWEQYSFSTRDQITQIRQAIRKLGYQVVSITVTNGGFYTADTGFPTISFLSNTGRNAAAVVSEGTAGVIQAIAVTNGGEYYTEPPQVLFSSGAATATATVAPTINLTEYELYPINFMNDQTIQQWKQNNSQSHDDFNSVLGLQSSDIEDVNWQDEKALEAWINLVYQELYSASAALGI